MRLKRASEARAQPEDMCAQDTITLGMSAGRTRLELNMGSSTVMPGIEHSRAVKLIARHQIHLAVVL
jgi:hypothetical protein